MTVLSYTEWIIYFPPLKGEEFYTLSHDERQVLDR